MSAFPEPRYRAVPARRAARVRQALARLGTLAGDAARVGTERWTDGMSRVASESRNELEQLGLPRAAQVVADALQALAQVRGGTRVSAATVHATLGAAAARRAARSLYAQVAPGRAPDAAPVVTAESAPALLARALLKLALLAGAARAWPDGPAPRALVEPLLRAALLADERPLLKGRVLVPLVAQAERPLAWDAGLGLVEVSRGLLPAGACALVGRLVCDHRVNAGGLTVAAVRRVTAGAAVGPGVDRRVLARAEPALAEVLRGLAREQADPFGGAPAPRLVGPLTHRRVDAQLGVDVLADAAGDACTVPGALVPLEGGAQAGVTWWLLAEPRARGGLLELAPLLAWCRVPGQAAQRVAVEPPPPAPPAQPEAVLDACAEVLAELSASGLARGLASRGAVRELAGDLAAGGHQALAERLRALPGAPAERASQALHGAVHLVDRLRAGPRALPPREGDLSK